jgi:hypothetical protein
MSFRPGSVVAIPTLTQRRGTPYMVDTAGRRTIGYGIIVEPVPQVAEVYSYATWSPAAGDGSVALIGVYMWTVRTWDIDQQQVVDERYPSARMDNTAYLADTLPPFGTVAVTSYDGDAPAPDLAALLAAERYAR